MNIYKVEVTLKDNTKRIETVKANDDLQAIDKVHKYYKEKLRMGKETLDFKII